MLSAVLSVSTVFFMTSSSDDQVLLRRLLNEEDSPTQIPTQSPTSSDCTVSWSGQTEPIDNPSLVNMGLVNTATTSEFIADTDITVSLDGDKAATFCQNKFGAGSVPVTPDTLNKFNGMVNLCESLGNGNTCYMGLFRKDYDGAKSDCISWTGENTAFTTNSNSLGTVYGTWANNQPSCNWLSSNHCLAYKTSSNKLKVVDCHDQMHIICTFTNQCTP